MDDDMALPEEAPEDMKAAAAAEFSLVEGLVREAARAKAGGGEGRLSCVPFTRARVCMYFFKLSKPLPHVSSLSPPTNV